MINQIYQVLLSILNKENQGYISPSEFNLIAANVQNEIFAEYFYEENRSKIKENKGYSNKGYANLDFNDRQKIEKFASFIGISVSSGVFTLPADLYLIVDDGVTTGELVIEEVERSRLAYLKKSEAKPTIQYPVYTRMSDSIIVSPLGINNILVDYLRKPTNPNWTFQVIENLDGSTVELYDPTSISFQDFDLHESEFSNIVLRMLVFFGINLRDAEVTQIAEIMKDKAFNKEVQ